MRLWMSITMLATLLPMVALWVWAWPALMARWRGAARISRGALLLLGLLGAAFLLARPHEDVFTGLDNMTYRNLAHAFADGRGFHDSDIVLDEVPVELRENFLLHRGPVGRPTRDRVFQLSGWSETRTQPFFMPTLSLGAAGWDSIGNSDHFVPLVGSLWWLLVLSAGFCAGGGLGILIAMSLVLGTAWPAWFLRGFYAEGVGAALIGAVVAAASVRPLRGWVAAVAGFALGFAVTYHPTLAVLSVPVALGLMLHKNHKKTAAAVAIGMFLGLIPFWALTRWVCQPYGDWTRWANLRNIIFSTPEHTTVAMALVLLAIVSLVVLCAGFVPAVRQWVRKSESKMTPWGWWILCGLAVGGSTAMVGSAGPIWSGIRWPFGALVVAGTAWILSRHRSIRERFGWTALLWAAGMFLFIQSVETPMGLWSHRRFLPIVLVGCSWLVAPCADGFASVAMRGRKWAWPAAILLAVAAFWNLVNWPIAFVGINERGATKWTHEIAQEIGAADRVIFDYYAHSIPYAAGLKHRVLGLNETSHDHWPETSSWISGIIQDEEVLVVTSWSPTALEDGWKLEPMFSAEGVFPAVQTKEFFPAVVGQRVVRQAILRAVRLEPDEVLVQDKVLDGSPIGLRGPWGPTRKGVTWSRQGSGIIGPVPAQGGAVHITIESDWTPPAPDWNEQILWIAPPWDGAPCRFQVPAGTHTLEVALVREDGGTDFPATGTYILDVERPYNPFAFGLRGYSSDLGVGIRRVIIQVEPSASSVPK